MPPGAEPGQYLGLIGPTIIAEGEGAQVGAGAAARLTFTVGPSSWLEGFLRWFWGFLMANPWIPIAALLLSVLFLAWLFRRRFRISVARRP